VQQTVAATDNLGSAAARLAHDTVDLPAPAHLEPRLSAQPVARRKGWRHYFGAMVLRLWGWTPEGNPPDVPKYVFIAAPHTSGWDFPFMIAFAWWWGVDIRWLGKHTLFSGIWGPFFRWFGGIPVDRSKKHDMIKSFARAFAERDELVLVIPAEGTRKYRDYWKSGFYWAARRAHVPVCLGYMDFQRKVGGFGPLLWPSQDLGRDMDFIRAFYTGMQGKHPEKFSRIRVRQEDDGIAAPTGGGGPVDLDGAGLADGD